MSIYNGISHYTSVDVERDTHGGSSGGGGESLTISTLMPCTPLAAIAYESSSTSYGRILLSQEDVKLKIKLT
jgi:hypothetical protein